MATIQDIVKRTHISKSTISRAIRDPKTVSSQKLAIINEAIKDLGYIPNYFASNLKAKNSVTIAFHINETQNLFFNKMIETLEKYFSKQGYKLIVSYGAEDENIFISKIKHLISFSPAALLFSPNKYSPDIEKMLKTNKIYALQLFSDTFENLDSLIVDDSYGTYLATKRLIVAGCKKIIIIGLEGHVFHKRIEGYTKAIKESNIPFDSRNIIRLNNPEGLEDIIHTNIISNNPDGIIAIANKVGLETQKVLNTMHKKIPDDISLIQYDDSPTAEIMGITAIGHTFDSLGKMISSSVIEGISHSNKEPIKKQFEPILIERDSIKKY